MKYITGIHALNIPCELDTCGDWHESSIQWQNPRIKESSSSIFEDYGIEKDKNIRFLQGKYNVANHIRALLDLMEEGNLSSVQGIRNDFICNDSYNNEIFSKVSMLISSPYWKSIDQLMTKEYLFQWKKYKKEKFLNDR